MPRLRFMVEDADVGAKGPVQRQLRAVKRRSRLLRKIGRAASSSGIGSQCCAKRHLEVDAGIQKVQKLRRRRRKGSLPASGTSGPRGQKRRGTGKPGVCREHKTRKRKVVRKSSARADSGEHCLIDESVCGGRAEDTWPSQDVEHKGRVRKKQKITKEELPSTRGAPLSLEPTGSPDAQQQTLVKEAGTNEQGSEACLK
eukprot:2119123-Amphidinium_carterae.1